MDDNSSVIPSVPDGTSHHMVSRGVHHIPSAIQLELSCIRNTMEASPCLFMSIMQTFQLPNKGGESRISVVIQDPFPAFPWPKFQDSSIIQWMMVGWWLNYVPGYRHLNCQFGMSATFTVHWGCHDLLSIARFCSISSLRLDCWDISYQHQNTRNL